MTHPTFNLRRAGLVLASATVLAAGLLASTASMASAFDNRMGAFVQHIKDDPGYKRIPLDTTADREWFYDLTEKVYEHKITKDQFVAEGAKKYPGYDSSFSEVADFMTMK
jgi:hypothetical protein